VTADAPEDATRDAPPEATVPPADGAMPPPPPDAPPPPPPNDAGFDAANVDAASVDASGWSPLALPGLVLWLNGDVGFTGTQWHDQSGRFNDATAGQGNVPPTSTTTLHGHAIVACGDVFMSIPDSTDFQWGTGDFGVFVVVSATGGPVIWEKQNAANGSLFLFQSGMGFEAELPMTNVVIGIPPNPAFHVLTVRGAAMELRIDGYVSTGPPNTVDISETNTPVNLCRGRTGESLSLGELIVVKGTVSDGNLAIATAYLRGKFGL
jgi:hypothetical protein